MNTLLACSGDGASAAIAESVLISQWCALVAAVLLAAILYDAVRTHIFGVSIYVAAAVFAMHPSRS